MKATLNSPIGLVTIEHTGTAVTKLSLLAVHETVPAVEIPRDSIIKKIVQYFHTAAELSDIPTSPEGTPFQQKVWAAMKHIKLGETVSYKTLAEQVGSHPRAVALACRNNPVALIIPCHRVVGQNNLGGFMGARKGAPLKIKEWLLRHERALD